MYARFAILHFNVEYDLHWRNPPWDPDVASLNGILRTRLGKANFTELGTGHAGQAVRLLASMRYRKLRFDFSDTFSEGFSLFRFAARRGSKMA